MHQTSIHCICFRLTSVLPLSPELNGFVHHNLDYTKCDLLFQTFQLFKYQMADMLQPARAVDLEQNFHNFLSNTSELADLFGKLPTKVVYYPLVVDCYNRHPNSQHLCPTIPCRFRIFYGRSKHPINCPGPVRCELPSLPGLHCAMGKRRRGHDSINRHLVRAILGLGRDMKMDWYGTNLGYWKF